MSHGPIHHEGGCPDEPKVHLVLYDNGQICTALVDNLSLAEKRARAVGGVIVELPILSDYRAEKP